MDVPCTLWIIPLLAIALVPETYGATNRTVVFMRLGTAYKEFVFLRGGLNSELSGVRCEGPVETNLCALPIRHNVLGTDFHYNAYNTWRQGDTRLDWKGAQAGQSGIFEGRRADGTPTVWTTNNKERAGFQSLNRWGDSYWMVDFDMDCSKTEKGWFEVKGKSTQIGWEQDIAQSWECTGDAGGESPRKASSHMARCGYVNIFVWNHGSCAIENF